MLHAIVISNGIGGADAYKNTDAIRYEIVEIGPDFDPDFSGYDVLIVPNGSDHVAMLKVRDKVRAFLDQGGVLFCFCGWFTDWIPGNRWIHDCSKATKDVRHFVTTDRYGFFDGVNVAKLDHNRHGISGWWACGYIEPAPGADVVLADPWGRALIVLDETTTAGTILVTASGPLGDYARYGDTDGLSRIYQNVLRFVATRQNRPLLETHR